MSEYKFRGYGFICTIKEKETVNIKTSRDYKALKAAFVDTITMDIGPTIDSRRDNLDKLIEEICNTGNKEKNILVIPSADTLGNSEPYNSTNDTEERLGSAAFQYYMILMIHGLHIIVLDSPSLSTTDLQLNKLITESDITTRQQMVEQFVCSKLKAHGRKSIPIDEKFKKIFWAWQNYFIDTADAVSLLGCSKTILYQLTKEYMGGFFFAESYAKDFKANMEDFSDKAVRGIVVDDDIENALKTIQRACGDEWFDRDDNEFSKALITVTSTGKVPFMAEDLYRFRLNYVQGRGAMVAATRKFSKGKDYVEQLRQEIAKISG